MFRVRYILFVCLLAAAVILVYGCSDEDDITTPTAPPVGTDEGSDFEIIGEIFDEVGIGEAFQSSSELTFTLLEHQFGEKAEKIRPKMSAAGSEDSMAITSVASYVYSEGWHIWTCSVTVYVQGVPEVDASLVDSVQALVNGVPQSSPGEDIDALTIIARFDWEMRDESHGASAIHYLSLLLNTDVQPNRLTITAEIGEAHWVEFSGDDADCELSIEFSEDISGLIFPMDASGDPMDCPLDGDISVQSNIDLLCTNEPTTLDTLMIYGEWIYTAAVMDNGTIRLSYSDNNMTLISYQTCVEEGLTKKSRWDFNADILKSGL